MMSRKKLLLNLLPSIGLLFLVGCASTGDGYPVVVGGDSKSVVAVRAEERWNALIAGNLSKAYEYFSPATREVMPFNVFQGQVKPGMWRGIKVDSVACEAELCKAALKLTYDLRSIKGLEMNLEEFWIKEEGSWWYVQKK